MAIWIFSTGYQCQYDEKKVCSLYPRNEVNQSRRICVLALTPTQAHPIIKKVVALQYIEGTRYNRGAKNERSSNGGMGVKYLRFLPAHYCLYRK